MEEALGVEEADGEGIHTGSTENVVAGDDDRCRLVNRGKRGRGNGCR